MGVKGEGFMPVGNRTVNLSNVSYVEAKIQPGFRSRPPVLVVLVNFIGSEYPSMYFEGTEAEQVCAYFGLEPKRDTKPTDEHWFEEDEDVA
jgi:hypothetical protein